MRAADGAAAGGVVAGQSPAAQGVVALAVVVGWGAVRRPGLKGSGRFRMTNGARLGRRWPPQAPAAPSNRDSVVTSALSHAL